MDAWETVERLAASARLEKPPRIDVTERVMQSLRARRPQRQRLPDTPLLGFSAISFASAVIVGLFAVQAWLSMHDPMVHLFDTVAMVMK
jgi:hypothetical protein